MNNTTAYPLCWPAGEPRTQVNEIKRAKFSRNNDRGWRSQLSVAQALRRLNEQLTAYKSIRVNPDTVIISSNMILNKDGSIRSSQRDPDDPAVAVYYVLDGKNICIPMDTYDRVADNIASVAQCIKDLRSLERHGHRISQKAYSGFTALPPPDQVSKKSWRDVLDYHGDDLRHAKLAYKILISLHHPDHGGDPETAAQINEAWKQAQEALK